MTSEAKELQWHVIGNGLVTTMTQWIGQRLAYMLRPPVVAP
jgi:hypothetical protein